MPAPCSWFAASVITVLPLALACGGDNGPPIRVTQPDAAIDAMEPCLAAETYTPTFAAADQFAEDYPAMGSGEDATLHNMYFGARLDATEPEDYLYFELYAQYGAFAGGDITTGTFPLAEDDAAYSSCGACVMVGADVTDGGVGNWYFASAGTLTLTSVTGRLSGSLSNVTLKRVIKDADGYPSDTPTFDCFTKIPSASFDVEITPGML